MRRIRGCNSDVVNSFSYFSSGFPGIREFMYKFDLSSARDLQLQTSFSPLVQTDNHVVQKFDTTKIYRLSNEVVFFAPFFVSFSLFAFKLGATAKLCLRNWVIY